MSKGNSRLFRYTSGANARLVQRLLDRNEKCTPENILGIVEVSEEINKGGIVWIESGTPSAGLGHIIKEHEIDFINKGIPKDEIPNYLMEAVRQGKKVGEQGSGPKARRRTIFEFIYEGKLQRVAIQIGSNGFIVSANPKSKDDTK